jgi:hypothetical protein
VIGEQREEGEWVTWRHEKEFDWVIRGQGGGQELETKEQGEGSKRVTRLTECYSIRTSTCPSCNDDVKGVLQCAC